MGLGKYAPKAARIDLVNYQIGVWYNGIMAVFKTVRCGFESYCPCQLKIHDVVDNEVFGMDIINVIISILAVFFAGGM
jgi:hypothetical protein